MPNPKKLRKRKRDPERESTDKRSSSASTTSTSSSTTSTSSSSSESPRPSISGQNPTISENCVVEKYDTKGTKRGSVLIINNIAFVEEKKQRKGAEIDEKKLVELFDGMGFTVMSRRDLEVSEMMAHIRTFKELCDGDISIVIIMSRGSNEGGFTKLEGIENRSFKTEKVVAEFSATNCPLMKGKPKIFFFQCCRGNEKQFHVATTVDSHSKEDNGKEVIREHGDILICYSTLPSHKSNRHTVEGTWYIQSICEVFKEHAKKLHVEDLLKLVDQRVESKKKRNNDNQMLCQTTTYENRGFNKHCYLNPKNAQENKY